MNHDEASELLAAYALDAVDEHERAAIEEHVEGCLHCQSDLDALREVAGGLGNSVEPLPERIWENISSRLYETRGEPPVLPPLVVPATPVTDIRRFQPRRVSRLVAVPFAVAAVIVAVLAFQLSGANHHVNQLQSALADSTSGDVSAALRAPGHHLVNLTGSTDKKLAQFVVLPDGRGYLVSADMPALPPSETYQLWGVINGKIISIGLMGGSPQHVTYTVAGQPSPTELAVSVEPSGGTAKPTTAIVASGTV